MAGRRPCAEGIWLWSVRTAVSLSGALAGTALALALIDLSLPLAVLVGALLGGSSPRMFSCGGRALRSAPPPDGRRRRIPTPPAVTRSGRGARLDSGYESGRRCGDPASSAASRRTAASRGERACRNRRRSRLRRRSLLLRTRSRHRWWGSTRASFPSNAAVSMGLRSRRRPRGTVGGARDRVCAEPPATRA
jgi:hypothetical protein